jgi:PTS system mannitol-specific IIC component
MKEKLQRIGGALAGMIIPNMGAFIAWGLITAFFIPTGWIPNEGFASLVSPMITYLLPILIAYNGGRMVHGVRGGVVGATVTMGIIVGTDVPQFLGAMIMGPLGGWLIKLIDDALEDKMPVGFEMLINNFTAGILAGILALLGYKFMSPVLTAISNGAEAVVDALINARLLPLAALIVEPAKVLFLNNALNHGVLAPLGVAAVEETGKAIHFLLETNPGPGLGLLVAYYVAGKGLLKESAPSAMIVHFLGGIHEIYFPFVLAHPIMIVAVIAGGFAADLWFTIFNAGVVATPSPGSIFAYLAVIPRGQHFPVLMGVLIGAVASFLVGALLLKSVVKEKDVEDEEDVEMDASAPIPGLG